MYHIIFKQRNRNEKKKIEQEKNIKRNKEFSKQEHKNLIQFVGHVLVCYFSGQR